jgi:hypothetical protein
MYVVCIYVCPFVRFYAHTHTHTNTHTYTQIVMNGKLSILKLMGDFFACAQNDRIMRLYSFWTEKIIIERFHIHDYDSAMQLIGSLRIRTPEEKAELEEQDIATYTKSMGRGTRSTKNMDKHINISDNNNDTSNHIYDNNNNNNNQSVHGDLEGSSHASRAQSNGNVVKGGAKSWLLGRMGGVGTFKRSKVAPGADLQVRKSLRVCMHVFMYVKSCPWC